MKMQEIADCLNEKFVGGWCGIDQPFGMNHWIVGQLVHTDGRCFLLGQIKDKFDIIPQDPKHGPAVIACHNRPVSIRVSDKKSAQQIAADIIRRLLMEYTHWFQFTSERIQRMNEDSNNRQQQILGLAALCLNKIQGNIRTISPSCTHLDIPFGKDTIAGSIELSLSSDSLFTVERESHIPRGAVEALIKWANENFQQ